MYPIILHIDYGDLNDIKIKQIKMQLPEYKMAIKNITCQNEYRYDCMTGQTHPLEIEKDKYMLLTIRQCSMDNAVAAEQSTGWHNRYSFTPEEQNFIKSIQKLPEVTWAIDNSFDGLYILKEDDYMNFRTVFKFAVYLKEEHATYWTLKYSGR